jgi:hypothetical protein
MDQQTRTELEAAAFRKLLEHLDKRKDVQNIDLMILSGFCRNCLSRWYKNAAIARGIEMDDNTSREAIYGMTYDEWKTNHQQPATAEQLDAFKKVTPEMTTE